MPVEALPHQAINLEIVEHSYAQPTVYQQNLMSLGTEVELLEICDVKDVTLTVLEGQGSLTLYEEAVTLEPGMFVFIPAQTPHTLRTQANLTLLLIRSRPQPIASESAWVINF